MNPLREQIQALQVLLDEAADHRPYKTAKSTGPGPRHGWAHATKHHKRDYWKCSCSNYTCKCKGRKGENKTVNLDKEYRSEYNAQYKAWYSARKKVATPMKTLQKQKAARARKARLKKKSAA